MALNTTNLGLNEINQHVDGNTGPLYNITANADLNAADVRAWGNANALAGYHTEAGRGGYGIAGVNTTNESEIAMGEFRAAAAPTVAFSGTMQALGKVIISGDQYVPNSYYSGYAQSVVVTGGLGNHNATSYTGTIFGVTGTHTLRGITNGGISTNGMIQFYVTNPTSAYTTTATDWTSLTVGSLTLTRATMSYVSANTTSGNSYGDNYHMVGSWGTYPNSLYAMSSYWTVSTTTLTSVTTKFNL
jgi:hypothetical protein